MHIFDLMGDRGIASSFLEIPRSNDSTLALEAGLANASLRRRSEFSAGRLAAKRALNELGVPVNVIPRSQEGVPLWPSGICGSISHSGTHACAIVANSEKYRSLGLDIEPIVSIPELSRLTNQFLSPAEAQLCTSDQVLVAFSVKESLFKMLFPLTRKFFGFDAARISAVTQTTATLVLTENIGNFASGTIFQALYGYHQNHVISACLI